MTQDAPSLDVQVEDLGPCSKKLTITVPADRVDREIDETYRNVMRAVQFPGFRAGKAPRKLVEAKLGPRVLDEVRQRLVESSVDEAVREREMKVIGTGDLDWENVKLERGSEMAFELTVDVHPEFDVPDLSGIQVERPSLDVTDEQIDGEIERLRFQQAKVDEAGDEPLADRGIAELEVAVRVGEETLLEGAETQWQHPNPVLGGMQIDGLADGLLGERAGSSVVFKQVLPDDFRDEQFRGKEAEITLDVKGVQKVTLPEVDDAFAQDMDYDDLEEMRDELRKQFERRLDQARDDALDEAVIAALIEAIPFELPPKLREQETERTLRRYEARLREQGIPEEQIPPVLAQARANADTEVLTQLKSSFILDRIGADRKVLVTESEVQQELANMATRYNRTPAEMQEYMERQDLMGSMRATLKERKTVRELRDVVQIVDAQADSDTEKEDA